jgi:hypothetical protein
MSHPPQKPESLFLSEPPRDTRLRQFWREYRWPLLLGLEAILFVLGYAGFAKYAAALGESRSQLDLLYLTLQLVTLESGAVSGPVSWELEVARLLLPAVTAYTALAAFALVFRKQIQSLKLWFIRDHTIVCGLDRKGYLLARDFDAQGKRVVVIEQDESNERIELGRARGIIVVTGDASNAEVLRRAGAHKARWLISVCGDDGTNAEVAVRAQALSAARRRGALTCTIHIVDPQLCELLREREIAAEGLSTFRLELFNVFDRGARILLREFPPFGADRADTEPPHLLVIGMGGLGESLVLRAARDWRNREEASGGKLRITVIDREADGKVESLKVRYPGLAQVCRLTPCQMEVHSADFQRAEFLGPTQEECDVDVAYVCLDDDSLGLHSGLMLLQRMRRCPVPIVIRMDKDAGLATLLRGNHGIPDAFGNLHAFALLDRTCTAEVVLGGTHEILARAAHAEYVRHQRQQGHTPQTNPLMVPWEQLPEPIKESNRRQVDHIGLKLKAVGCGLAPLTDWDAASFAFTPEEVERMARMEHERWCEERCREGWRHASGPKNPQAKTHPALLPWEELPPADKAINRTAVREMPAFLVQAGLQIYRLK